MVESDDGTAGAVASVNCPDTEADIGDDDPADEAKLGGAGDAGGGGPDGNGGLIGAVPGPEPFVPGGGGCMDSYCWP